MKKGLLRNKIRSGLVLAGGAKLSCLVVVRLDDWRIGHSVD
jgi:hypothetical protein